MSQRSRVRAPAALVLTHSLLLHQKIYFASKKISLNNVSSSGDLTTNFYFPIDSDPKKSASHKFFEPNQANGSKKSNTRFIIDCWISLFKKIREQPNKQPLKCFELSIHLFQIYLPKSKHLITIFKKVNPHRSYLGLGCLGIKNVIESLSSNQIKPQQTKN